MNLQTFFDNLELLAEAPNGVQKLRELILQLAVMGKLAPQDPNDEPASVLFDKLKAEKILLINKNKIKKARTYNKIDETEIPYKLPENWRWVRLADVGYDLGQKKPDVKFTYIDVSAINKEKGIISDDFSILQPDEAPSRARKIVSKGTVIYSTVRPYLLNIAIVDRQFEPEPIVSTAFAVLHPFPSILAKYLYFYLRSKTFIEYVEVQMKGMAYPAINDAQLYQGLLPLPPLKEQHRIVAKLDQLMKLCDELEARQQKKREARVTINNTAIAQLLTAREPEEFNKSWQRIYNNFDLLYSTPENIGKLRSCILQLAVMGKLAPQNPSDEPASVLLEKIKVEKELLINEGEIKKEKPLPTIPVEQQPYEIPQAWRWIRLADISKTIEYGTSEKSLDIGDVPIFRMNNIRDGKILFYNLKYVDNSIKDLPRLYLQDKDLLFNRTNSYELVGKTGVFRGESYRYTFASYLIRISLFSEHINPELINMVMNSYYFRQTQIEPEITQQCGQANFNGTKLKNTIIPLPPLSEQHRIVTKVNQLMTLCDKLEAQLKQSVDDSEKLMQTAVRQLLEVNTVAADNICVEPTTLETKTVKQSSKKTQTHGGEAVQLNLQLF